MGIMITKAELPEILPMRSLFMQENNFQIRYNAQHERGWSDSYLVTKDSQAIGYGSTMGHEDRKNRDTIFEFYIIPSFRGLASVAFLELLRFTKVRLIECQSNDLLITSMLVEFGRNISSDTILFKEGVTTSLSLDHVVFRKRLETDEPFEHKAEPLGDFVLEKEKEIVATGGFLLHCNFPFADLYMEVREDQRRKGLGSYLIQELKRECYLFGRVPAARTGMDNLASRATLLKAGLQIAGYMLLGEVKQ